MTIEFDLKNTYIDTSAINYLVENGMSPAELSSFLKIHKMKIIIGPYLIKELAKTANSDLQKMKEMFLFLNEIDFHVAKPYMLLIIEEVNKLRTGKNATPFCDESTQEFEFIRNEIAKLSNGIFPESL